jgi:hypothetical protein
MTTNDLILNMIIFGLTSKTDNPVKSVQKLNKKYLKALRNIYRSNESFYNQAYDIKKIKYANAWQECFGHVDSSVLLSIGYIMDVLSSKLDTYIVGRKVFEKASASFYYSKEEMGLSLEIEQNSQKLCDAIFEQLGISANDTLKQLRIKTMNTLILEGKI